MPVNGWPIAGLTFLVMLGLFTAVLGIQGGSEDALRLLVRLTAQCSVSLFVLAFSASSLRAFIKRRWTGWLLRNRRYIGVSFAVAHGAHLAVLVALAAAYPVSFRAGVNSGVLIGGAATYALIAAMTATSNNVAVRWMGPKRWTRLHTIGGYYIWVLFALSYGPRAMNDVFYVPFAGILVVAMALRIARRMRRPRTRLTPGEAPA